MKEKQTEKGFVYSVHHAPVLSLAWKEADGMQLLVSAGELAHVWEPFSGVIHARHRGHSGRMRVVAWAPNDDGRIASADSGTAVEVWNWSSLPEIRSLPLVYTGHTSWVNALSWSPDGNRIASASSDGTVQIWASATGERLLTYVGHHSLVNAVFWSPDGTRIVSAGSDVQVWDAAMGIWKLSYQGHSDVIYAVSWSPNCTRIASAGSDGQVHIWDAVSGLKEKTLQEHESTVYALSWSPDGTRIASAGEDRTVRIWSVAMSDGCSSTIYRGHRRSVKTVAWSPNGILLASGAFDGTVQVWAPTEELPMKWMEFLHSEEAGPFLCIEYAHVRLVPWMVLKVPPWLQSAQVEDAFCQIIEQIDDVQGSHIHLLFTLVLCHVDAPRAPATMIHLIATLPLMTNQAESQQLLSLLTEAHALYVSAFCVQPGKKPRRLWEHRWVWLQSHREMLAHCLARAVSAHVRALVDEGGEQAGVFRSHAEIHDRTKGEMIGMISNEQAIERAIEALARFTDEFERIILSTEHLSPTDARTRYNGRIAGIHHTALADAVEVQYAQRRNDGTADAPRWSEWSLVRKLVVEFVPGPHTLE